MFMNFFAQPLSHPSFRKSSPFAFQRRHSPRKRGREHNHTLMNSIAHDGWCGVCHEWTTGMGMAMEAKVAHYENYVCLR